jgi:medium-chain acyl-[acyl-carrier-protein] hydrolase
MTNNISNSSTSGGGRDKKGWVAFPRPNPHAPLRLFVFPYAGGSAVSFRPWPQNLPEDVEVCPVEIPGRGRRMAEPLYTDLMALSRDMTTGLLSYLDKPFVFFGHSMGALFGFEMARILRASGGPQPLHMFVSACRAPQYPERAPIVHGLPESELLEYLRQLDGTPKEVLDQPELRRLLLPILRADFELVDTYEYSPGEPLDFPITAYGGLQDYEETEETIAPWRAQTTSSFSMRMFDGGHFFIHSSQQLLLQLMSLELYRILERVK